MENHTKEGLNKTLDTKQCSHLTLTMEVAYGGPTGNFICMQCECLITPGAKQQSQPGFYPVRKKNAYPLRLPAFIA